MINTRGFAILIPLVNAQDLSSCRNYNLGMNLAAVAEQADMKVPEARLVCGRPAVIQELQWQPSNSYNSSAQTDPVSGIRFIFYNDEHFRIIVGYNHDRADGLTNDDLIDSISVKYGTPTSPAQTISIYSSSYLYSQDIARWEDLQYSSNLFRESYQSTHLECLSFLNGWSYWTRRLLFWITALIRRKFLNKKSIVKGSRMRRITPQVKRSGG